MTRTSAMLLALLGTLIAGAAEPTATAPVTRPALEPADLIPVDALLCWHGRRLPDTPDPAGQPSPWQALVDVATRVAGQPLERSGQLTIRGLELFSQLIRYPHAIAVLDAAARPIGDGTGSDRKVDDLKLVVAIRTDGANEPLLKIIQKAINEQTSAQTAELRARHAGQRPYHELRDTRTDDWMIVAWGELHGHFVLTLGRDVWPRVAEVVDGAQPAVTAQPWYARVREESQRDSLIEIFVDARAIRARLDPLTENRASDFFRAWRSADVHRAHWALGFRGPALFNLAHFEAPGETRRRVFADPEFLTPALRALVPADARWAVYRVRPGELLPRFFSSLTATRGPLEQERIHAAWQRIQKQHGFDVERDVLANLGEHILLHNAPPHPLRLPLAMTTLTEIRAAPERVRACVDTLCAAWRDAVAGDAALESAAPFTIDRDADGIWSLRFGILAGPAWLVTDKYIVTSWSPAALREYVGRMWQALRGE